MRRSIRTLLLAATLAPAGGLLAQDPPSDPEVVRITAPSVARPENVGLPWDPAVGYVRQFTGDTLVLDATTRDGVPATVSFPLASIVKVEIHTYRWRGLAESGDSVRVIRRDGQAVEGLLASSTDTLLLTLVRGGGPVSLAPALVDRFLVRKGNVGKGARVGVEVGLALGLLTGFGSWGVCPLKEPPPGSRQQPEPCGVSFAQTVGGGVFVVGLIGAVVGASKISWQLRERTWVAIPVERLRQQAP